MVYTLIEANPCDINPVLWKTLDFICEVIENNYTTHNPEV